MINSKVYDVHCNELSVSVESQIEVGIMWYYSYYILNIRILKNPHKPSILVLSGK